MYKDVTIVVVLTSQEMAELHQFNDNANKIIQLSHISCDSLRRWRKFDLYY